MTVDLNDRHFLSFDETLFDRIKAHHRDRIDRRGLTMRGYSPWLMATILDGLESGHVPPDPGLDLGIRRECRWPPGLHLALVEAWENRIRQLGGSHARGHSMIVNLWAYEALERADEVLGGQLSFPGLSASTRRGRVAHTPVGAPDRAYLV